MKRGSCSVKTSCVALTSRAQYCINSCRCQQNHIFLPKCPFRPNARSNKWFTLIRHTFCHKSDLEIVPDIRHAPLHKGLSGFFLQWRPSHIQSVDISQVVNAANIHPVPGADLCTQHHVTLMPRAFQIPNDSLKILRRWTVVEKDTNHWALVFLPSFLNVFLDLLKTPLFTQLTGHPQCALEAG